MRSYSSNCPIVQVHYNQCQCLPKAELKTKTNPNGHHSVAVWVRFGFQLNSLEKKWSAKRGKPCSVFVLLFCLSKVASDSDCRGNYLWPRSIFKAKWYEKHWVNMVWKYVGRYGVFQCFFPAANFCASGKFGKVSVNGEKVPVQKRVKICPWNLGKY